MITISACIEMLFREEPDFVKRIDLAADAGLKAVEFWGYSNKDLTAIRDRADARGLEISSTVVEFQPLNDMGNNARYVEAVRAAADAAAKLRCTRVISCTGNEIAGVPAADQRAAVVSALKAGAPVAEDAGITIVLEPLNTLVDHKGYFLWSSLEGFAIVEEVGSPAVRLLFDIYHQQVMEGNLIANLTRNVNLLGHLHIADVPGRHEPGTGEINYENVLKAVDVAGYDGFAALEYSPTTADTADSLKHILAVRDKLGMR